MTRLFKKSISFLGYFRDPATTPLYILRDCAVSYTSSNMLNAHAVPVTFSDYDIPITVKTPGRALHRNRRENVYTVGALHRKKVHIGTPLTGKGKGKVLGLGKGPQTESSMLYPTIHSRTDLISCPETQYLLTLNDSESGTSKHLKKPFEPAQTTTRPLGDKTPAPNRAAQLLQAGKLGKLEVAAQTPAPAPTPFPRPSSARKSTRARRSSSLSIAGLQQKLGAGAFQTPRTNGCPWDVSDVDIQVPETMDEELEGEVAEQGDDDSDIEYMPPKVEGTVQGSFLRDFVVSTG
jgi:hypothetical protein